MYTVWTDDDPTGETLTVIEGAHYPGHRLLHVIEAPSWEAAMTRYHELMGWDPYKPMTRGGKDADRKHLDPPGPRPE